MNHPLKTHWDRLSDASRTILSLAHRHSQNQGHSGRLRTRYVVAALRSLTPDPLNNVLAELPDRALPDPIPIQKPPTIEPLNEEQPALSPCVRETLTKLGEACPPSQSITPLDLFVDLARHGGGSTVSTLREHGVTADEIERLLRDVDPTVLKRQ